MVRMTHSLGMLLLVCTSVGCGHMFDYVDSTTYRIKCKHQAKMAWMDAQDLYGSVSHPYNFGEGFRAGYADVCMGNDSGCSPVMPPRRYWSSCYLNCEGQAKSMAWMDGFAHGTLAASCDGCGGHCHVATYGGGGSGGGSGALGTALKGYKPPTVINPNQVPPEEYEPQPTLTEPPYTPPPANDIEPGGVDELAPEPPQEEGVPLEVWQQPMGPPPAQAVDYYHAPVF